MQPTLRGWRCPVNVILSARNALRGGNAPRCAEWFARRPTICAAPNDLRGVERSARRRVIRTASVDLQGVERSARRPTICAASNDLRGVQRSAAASSDPHGVG
ncbi:hypothetical protein ACWD0Z_35875 [Streptomyces sp. NPDC003007]